MSEGDFWNELLSTANSAATARATAEAAKKEYAEMMEKVKRLVATTGSLQTSSIQIDSGLAGRVALLENELRFVNQSIEALATELKQLKSQERENKSHPCEKSDVDSQFTTGQRGGVAERIASHVQSKMEAFYPAQVARELDIPESYVAKILRDLAAKGVLRTLDNNGYRGRKHYMVNRPL